MPTLGVLPLHVSYRGLSTSIMKVSLFIKYADWCSYFLTCFLAKSGELSLSWMIGTHVPETQIDDYFDKLHKFLGKSEVGTGGTPSKSKRKNNEAEEEKSLKKKPKTSHKKNLVDLQSLSADQLEEILIKRKKAKQQQVVESDSSESSSDDRLFSSEGEEGEEGEEDEEGEDE